MSEREWRDLLLAEIRDLRKAVADLQQAVAGIKAASKVQSGIFGGLAGMSIPLLERLFNK